MLLLFVTLAKVAVIDMLVASINPGAYGGAFHFCYSVAFLVLFCRIPSSRKTRAPDNHKSQAFILTNELLRFVYFYIWISPHVIADIFEEAVQCATRPRQLVSWKWGLDWTNASLLIRLLRAGKIFSFINLVPPSAKIFSVNLQTYDDPSCTAKALSTNRNECTGWHSDSAGIFGRNNAFHEMEFSDFDERIIAAIAFVDHALGAFKLRRFRQDEFSIGNMVNLCC